MIRNYFKIAWRNLKKKKLNTAIHILGLFIGISFALLIAAFVWQELQVNKNLKNAERQYLLTSQWKNPNTGADFTTLAPLAESLKENYPQLVANYYRWDGITSIISNGNMNYREGIQLGDESFLEMYGFELLHGNAKTAFENPFSVIIKSGKAIKFFGKTDVVGKTLTIQNFDGESNEFTITGVLAEISKNSVSEFFEKDDNGFFIAKNSATYFNRDNFQNWESTIYVSYIELQPGKTPRDLEIPIQELIKNHTSEEIQKNLSILPVKLSDYYLEKDDRTIKQMLYTLSFIGLFILLMAMINFINISISHSGSRMREIGIRKVLGGRKKQLIIQFLSESIILTGIATILACIAYPFLGTWFGELIGKELISLSQFPIYFILIPLLLVLVIGILAGLYPAVVLSSFKSIDALKGKLKNNYSSETLRKTLLGFQYVTALVVLISALIVAKQVDFFFGKGLGYDKDYVVTAAAPRDWTPEGIQKMKTIRDDFKKIPSVQNVSLSYEIPNGNNGFQISSYKAGENPDLAISAQGFVADESYLETYKIPLLAGRNLLDNEPNANKVVINKKAVEAYGFKNAHEAIDQQLTIVGEDEPLIITGVFGDFHFETMQQPIKPQVIFNVNSNAIYRYFTFKINPNSVHQSLAEIQKKWQVLMPGSSFEYKFMDETLENLYAREIRFRKAATTATVLALLIALMGIFGMVALNIDKRIKEMGIRKILGASIKSIGYLFIKEFLIVLAIAIIIACSLAYWLMQLWLENYSYRITIGIKPFLTAIILIGSITVVLILLQTLKIAMANPVKSLRTE
ncbi:ABC transporter permease [Gillisia sp. Hel_I_86]|uniref:ABC transporter permease n=1 Tax=Gillisia sp. Hel_I_86 TaxID=1249981 RepID=UPI0011AB06A8|nr:ABC transporter permease [Gillisia sp. Hel_I_86]